jgi:hypothetical protein
MIPTNIKFLKSVMFATIFVEILLCIFFYFAFLDIKNKNYNISVLTGTLSAQMKKQEYMYSMDKIIKNTDSDLVRVNDLIIQKGADVDFIENIEAMAKSNDLSIKIDSLNVEQDPSLRSGDLTILKAKTTVSGLWSGIYAFLLQIESSTFKIKIDKLALVENVDEENPRGGHHWQAVFEMSISKYK